MSKVSVEIFVKVYRILSPAIGGSSVKGGKKVNVYDDLINEIQGSAIIWHSFDREVFENEPVGYGDHLHKQ